MRVHPQTRVLTTKGRPWTKDLHRTRDLTTKGHLWTKDLHRTRARLMKAQSMRETLMADQAMSPCSKHATSMPTARMRAQKGRSTAPASLALMGPASVSQRATLMTTVQADQNASKRKVSADPGAAASTKTSMKAATAHLRR